MANSASTASSSSGRDLSRGAAPDTETGREVGRKVGQEADKEPGKGAGRRGSGASRSSGSRPAARQQPGRPNESAAKAPARKPANPPSKIQPKPPAKPDVDAIMADIRKTVRERAEEGGLTEREFRARHLQRMLRPLAGPGISDDFADRFRSRDPEKWNVRLTGADFHGGGSAAGRFFRRVLRPLARLLVDLAPAAEQAARQAEINEYYRRLLWATNRDLEQARLELDLLKRELRRFGVRADFSFRAPSGEGEGGGGAPPRGGGSERPRRREGGGPDRQQRGDGRRKSGGRQGGRSNPAGRSNQGGRSHSGRRSGGGGSRGGRGGGRGSSGGSGGSAGGSGDSRDSGSGGKR